MHVSQEWPEVHVAANKFIRDPKTALFNHKCKICTPPAAQTLLTNSTWEIPIEFRAVRLIPVPARQSPPLVITQHGVCERMLSGHSRTLGAQYSHLKPPYMPPVIFSFIDINKICKHKWKCDRKVRPEPVPTDPMTICLNKQGSGMREIVWVPWPRVGPLPLSPRLWELHCFGRLK